MKTIKYFGLACVLMVVSIPSFAFSVWVVESGEDAFSNGQGLLSLDAGTTSLDLYYDVEGDTSYGYDLSLLVDGVGSIANVGGGDSDLGASQLDGWRQFGGPILGETGSSVFGFSFDFTAEEGAVLSVSGTYTDQFFGESLLNASNLAEVAPVPLPAAAWLFGSAILGLGLMRRKAS